MGVLSYIERAVTFVAHTYTFPIICRPSPPLVLLVIILTNVINGIVTGHSILYFVNLKYVAN